MSGPLPGALRRTQSAFSGVGLPLRAVAVSAVAVPGRGYLTAVARPSVGRAVDSGSGSGSCLRSLIRVSLDG